MLIRAWSRVHGTRTAMIELTVVTVLSLASFRHVIERLGPISLPSQVLASMLIPIIAGVAVATAAINEVRLELPDPWRARVARFGWSAVWVIVATGAVLSGLLIRGASSDLILPPIRNVLIFSAISLPLASEGRDSLIWMPSVLLALVSAVFGFRSDVDEWHWWAVILDGDATAYQLLIAAILMVLATVHYACRNPAKRHIG